MNASKKSPSLTDFKPVKLIFIRLSSGTLAAVYCWYVAILIRREDCSTFSPLFFFLPELSDHLFPQNKKQNKKNNPSKSAAFEVRLRVTATAFSIHSANRRATNPLERMQEDMRLYIRQQKMGREHNEPNSWTEQEQERRGEEKQDGQKGRNNDEDNEQGDDDRSR